MPAHHHTVPRTYLSGFATPKGRLRAFDRLTQRTLGVNLATATAESDMYTLPTSAGIDPDLIEKWLSDKEGAAAGSLADIRSGQGAPTEDNRWALAEFIAAQMTRTTRVRDAIDQIGDWYGKVWFEGITREGVEEWLRSAGKEPIQDDVDSILDFARNIDSYRFVPPRGSFLVAFVRTFQAVLPYLVDGWDWVVVRSSRPFLTSDNPVVLVGDSVDGGLGVATASEIWLPVGRHYALVLTRDHLQPAVILDLPPIHTKRLCQRIALESTRWVYWHPNDDALDGVVAPVPLRNVRIESVGRRERGDGTTGELIRVGSNRPNINGECLLNGVPVRDHHRVLAPPWQRTSVKQRTTRASFH